MSVKSDTAAAMGRHIRALARAQPASKQFGKEEKA